MAGMRLCDRYDIAWARLVAIARERRTWGLRSWCWNDRSPYDARRRMSAKELANLDVAGHEGRSYIRRHWMSVDNVAH